MDCWDWVAVKQPGAGFKSYGHAQYSLDDPSCPAQLKLTNSILAAFTMGSAVEGLGTNAKLP
jgi:hypothetical protein